MLLAEDDRAIRHALQRALTLEGYEVTAVPDGVQALAVVHKGRPDALVLDVMMPGIDGLQVCRVLREGGDRTPILMLTAKVETSDRIAGLDAGADDYVPKPFEVEEVFARLRALLRRAGSTNTDDCADGVVEALGIRLDLGARRAWHHEQELELTRTEFNLLELLVRNHGNVLGHALIYERIWGYDFGPSSKNLAVYIGYLRRKLHQPGHPAPIHSVRGVGYTLREAP
ncbi:response regulator transcription factor [Streptomyces axinellae]|uniref:Response regulator transcription factor n=1 Tax=Streptomyces axinellae TaxID=552788 RepID=A0ABP6CCL3_9ACTN